MIQFATAPFGSRVPRATRFAVGSAIAAVLAFSALPAAAQSADAYPSRPAKILVPYAPGGATDIIARHVANKLNELFGQGFVVENRAGACIVTIARPTKRSGCLTWAALTASL